MTLIELARKLRPIIEQAAQSLDDKTASGAAELFPFLRCDKVQTADTPAIQAGTRINWRGIIKKAKLTLWDIEAYNPDNAPDYWDDIKYRDGARVIPDTVTAELAFDLDELGWWEGAVYKSMKAGNVHTPAQAPEVWVKQ